MKKNLFIIVLMLLLLPASLIGQNCNPPANLTATALPGSVSLNWEPSTDSVSGTTIFFESFESYNVGGYAAQQAVLAGSTAWTTWTQTPGSAEDPLIDTTYASDGDKAVKLIYGNDFVLNMNDKTIGRYLLSFEIYLPTGKDAYFNILHDLNASSSEWSCEAYLNSLSNGTTITAGGVAHAFTPIFDQWVPVLFDIDLDADSMHFYFNDSLVATWQYSLEASSATTGLKKLDGMDFFPPTSAAVSEFYIDKVQVVEYDVQKYNIYRDNVQIANNVVGTTYTNVSLQVNTQYCYTVTQVCDTTESANSNQACATTPNVTSMEVTVGTGTTNGYYAPFNNFYRNSWSQTIYSASEIGVAGLITEISYDCAAVGSFIFTTLDIYMGHTEATENTSTTSWLSADDLDLVYSGTNIQGPAAVGWFDISLDDPFFYNGTDNLVIVVSKSTGSYSSALKWNYTSITNSYLYRQSDSDLSYASHPGTSTGTRQTYRANVKLDVSPSTDYCFKPATVSFDSISQNSAYVTWDMGTVNAWNLRYGPSGFDPDIEGNGADSLMVNNYHISGLSPSLSYDVYIQAICDSVNISGWKKAVFNTLCGTTPTPFTENFDLYPGTTSSTDNNLPYCWSYINNGASSYLGYPIIYNSSSSAYSGSNFLRFYTYYTTAYGDQYAILPLMDSINTLQLSCMARESSTTSSYIANIAVGVMSDPADESTFVQVGTIAPTTLNYEEYVVYFNNYTGNGQYIALKAIRPSSGYNIAYIDDVIVETIPSCISIDDLTLVNKSSDEVTLGWTEMGSATAWEIEYGLSGFTSGQGDTIISADTNVFTILGLAPMTTYDFYVRAVCSSDSASQSVSTWEGPLSVTTLIACSSGFNSAQTIIGNSVVQGYNMPINTFYNYSYSQQIYTSDELFSQGLVSGLIHTMGFQYFYSVAQNPKAIKIYMGITQQDQFTAGGWVSDSSLTLVYDGTITFDNSGTDNWFEIQLQYPFNYDGSGNIVVAVLNNSGNYTTSSSPTFYFHTTSVARTLYCQNDSSPYTTVASMPTGSTDLDRNNIEFLSCVSEDICMPPMNLSASQIDSISAQLSWTNINPSLGWNIEYGLQGFEHGTGTTDYLPDSVMTYSLNNLTSNTLYDFYVNSVCSDSVNSVWAKTSFRTLCGSSTIMPYVENFDSYQGTTSTTEPNNLPDCWNYINTGASSYTNYPIIYSSTSSAYSGGNMLRFYNYYSTAYGDQYAILPPVSNVSALQLSLKARMYSTSTIYTSIITVGVMDSINGTDSFVPIATIEPQTTTYQDFTVYFSNYSGTGKRIALLAEKPTTNYNSICVDNIVLDSIPECPPVSSINVVSVDTTTATLSWISNGHETSWTVQYGPVGFNLGTGDSIVTNNNPTTITNINHSTGYDCYVKPNCEDGQWTGPLSFYTAQIPASLPYTCGFEASEEEALHWTLENGNQFNKWCIGHDYYGFSSYSGTSGLFISYDNGQTNYYSNQGSTVYAYRTFDLNSGDYVVSFKWICNGQDEYDYIRAFLVPAGQVLEAGQNNGITSQVTPSGWIALGNQLNQDTAWNSYFNEEVNVATSGLYNFVFYWTNNGSISNFPAPAVDNVQLFALTCPLPSNLACSASDQNSATISWTEEGTSTSWNLEYGIKGFAQGSGTVVSANTNPYVLTNLQSSSQYDVYVQSDCGSEDGLSGWRGPLTFTTASCSAENMCPIYLELHDQVYDGWNDASISVYTNGIFVSSYTINSGVNHLNVTVPLCPGTTSFKWNKGIFDNECSFVILDNNHDTLTGCIEGAAAYYENEQTFFTFEHSCENVVCSAPTNVNATQNTNAAGELAVGLKVTWDAAESAISYKVYRGNEEVATGLTTTTYTETPTSSAQYCYTVKAVCEEGESVNSVQACVNYDATIGVGENAADQARLFPNPTNGKIMIVAADLTELTIMNITGQILCNIEVSGDEYEFDFDKYEAGVYMIRIATESGSSIKRVTVVR